MNRKVALHLALIGAGVSKNDEVIGYNYRTRSRQTVIGLAQGEGVIEILEKEKSIAKLYEVGLTDLPLNVQPHMIWAESFN